LRISMEFHMEVYREEFIFITYIVRMMVLIHP